MSDIQAGSVVCHQYSQYNEYDQESYHLPFSFVSQSESEDCLFADILEDWKNVM